MLAIFFIRWARGIEFACGQPCSLSPTSHPVYSITNIVSSGFGQTKGRVKSLSPRILETITISDSIGITYLIGAARSAGGR